jgi:hypothetical protein
VLRATQATRVAIFGGEPLDGPRFVWWNFVSSRRESIEDAKAAGSTTVRRHRRRDRTDSAARLTAARIEPWRRR